jgi:hypothetical protein
MKNIKPKKSITSEKAVFKKKKSLKSSSSLLKKPAPPIKKLVSVELTETKTNERERTEWRKEKREYWSSRFRKILAEIAIKPKAKKSSFF